MLQVSNLSFHYQPNVPVLTNLTFSVPDGEIVGLLGKNGVGKTTTLKLILGLLPIEKGTLTLEKYSLDTHPLQYKKRINYVSDNHEIYNNLTGKEYLNFIADMYEVSTETRTKIYAPLIKVFQVEKYLNQPIKKLSHGTKQKIAIISSLVNDPQLWVLDEPMTGLDVEAVQALKKLIKSRKDSQKSVLFSSHILEICEKVCDKVAIMQSGTIKKTITLHENPLNITLEDIYIESVT
ncbi:ATP-binding cassette domain-containing protein [Lachnospiraceae bacterium WCA-9-b2]|uniref:ATP-binding cassette domain-containing protein n=1 Tax=Sporofaciens musculi TaxID=2681861 RepID=A0A7X3MGD6_9FIRM|nr:ABC transporter ATP-binding protein [Sporofaciens musculi]MXP75946.1 ATP-binding cassette domain-containing protein [Sporofaciens musculi]